MNDIKSLKMDTRVSRNQQMVAGDVDGETVMMSIENGKYYSLNPTGSRIWELLEQPRSVGDIVESLVQEYDVPRDRCEKDVLDYLGDMLARDILTTL